MLNMIVHGEKTERPGLLICHGLYGSARNWGVIAKRLSDERQVIAVDMRNHGQSDWFESHSYHDLAQDLAGVLDHLEGPWDVLGHSMGGKAAMTLALTHPELVNRLIVGDIAPVSYTHSQIQYIHAMRQVDLDTVHTRADAAQQLRPHVDNPALVAFFLQSLDLKNKCWRLNLDVLAAEMPKILGFPDLEGCYTAPTLFLTGRNSDYVLSQHRKVMRTYFPSANVIKLNDAGHWLHADQPRAFEHTVRHWLNSTERA